ncbi:MAG TPA: Uma2 family endonuclease [Pyrinomonadaceae bacterium]
MSAHIQPLLTIADLEVMPDDENRYELMEGEIIVSRALGLTHQRILTNLLLIIGNYLAQHPLGEAFATPGVIFDEYNSVIPDIAFVSRERIALIASGERITGAPELMIEIVSPGSENARRDRVVKRQVYGKHGVQEYWVIDPENRTLKVYRLQQKSLELFATLADQNEVASPLLPHLSFPAIKIFNA